jgi:hypothetical protein
VLAKEEKPLPLVGDLKVPVPPLVQEVVEKSEVPGPVPEIVEEVKEEVFQPLEGGVVEESSDIKVVHPVHQNEGGT